MDIEGSDLFTKITLRSGELANKAKVVLVV